MATYIIGDVQGCFDELMELLNKIHFDSTRDRLGFVGDLVNRGPASLQTLRFIHSLPNPMVVLGNHDLHLLALGYGVETSINHDDLIDILQAPDKEELLDWLRKRPLVYHNTQHDFLMVHAGIPPQWDAATAVSHAKEVEAVLQGPQCTDFLLHMHGNEPAQWHDHLTGWDRLRYIINAFTRLRFCNSTGRLDLINKTRTHENPKQFRPWFQWRTLPVPIIFGHWASLEGHCDTPQYYALDTGCVWGRELTALRLEDLQLFSVASHRA